MREVRAKVFIITTFILGLLALISCIPKEREVVPLKAINRVSKTESKQECLIAEIRRFDKGSVQAKVETHKVCVWLKYTLTDEEFELLCRTTFCEAGNQDLDTQVMVCLTILNRLNSKKFPNSIKEVIYQQDAYEVTEWEDFENYGWTEQVEKAVKIALRENNHPADMYYFRTEHYHKFGKPYMQSDDLWFSTEQ